MKVWKKLSLMTVLALLLASGIWGAVVIYRSAGYLQEKTMESSRLQLRSTAFALGRELENSPIQSYSEVARNSYIDFLIKKYGADSYMLIENGQVVCNLTPFELTNPGDERWNRREEHSIIQNMGEQYILVAGKKVPAMEGMDYHLVFVQDISGLYKDIKSQVFFSFGIWGGAALCSVLVIFLLTRKILSPLKELQQAAKDISNGELTRRVESYTKDEIGLMAAAFNSMAERIENQMMALSQVSEQRRQMLGSLTHEMKTPMTSIIGYSETLLNVNLKKEQQERALWHINKECSRLERLSSKLMSLMGLYDNESICMEQTSMKDLFEQTARLEEHHLKQKNIKLEYECSMPEQRIDRDLFESLLINLIDNAAKASGEGCVISLIGNENQIIVRDEGCGIPEDEIARVMDAFYMVDKARSRKEGGCGLGLALCSRIAALHGAELLIESQMGKGTQVSVIFTK